MCIVEDGEHWPLRYCAEVNRMTVNTSKLRELIDTRNGLLNEMFAVECTNNRQKHWIEEGATDELKNERLYFEVKWGSLAAYNAYIHCLLASKQAYSIKTT